MNSYLFTGWISQFRSGHLADACVSLLFCGGTPQSAQARFEEYLLSSNHAEPPVPTKIEKVLCVPLHDQLLTETAPSPLDWAAISKEMEGSAETEGAEADNADWTEQGYWADCNELVNPHRLSADLEALRRELPEDVRSGLNWSADRKYFYLVSTLSPPPPPPDDFEEEDPETQDGSAAARNATDEDGLSVPGSTGLHLREAAFPELAAKEAAGLVQARNSVVAAWLWRRHTAGHPWARNPIRIDPWCGVGVAEA